MRLALAVQSLMLRTGARLGGPWRASHLLLMRAVAVYLRIGTGASVYVRGSFGRGEAVPGLSDVDLVVVAPESRPCGARWAALQHRRDRLCRPSVLARILTVALYGGQELADAWSDHALAYATNTPRDGDPRTRALHFRARAPADELGLRTRPVPPFPGAGWRLLAGREVRPRPRSWPLEERPTVAWLEIQYWWRHAFRLALQPRHPAATYLCVKLVAEPGRVTTWLEHGDWPRTREEALERLLDHPEEAEAAARALELERRLPAPGSAPVGLALASLVRSTGRVAALLGDSADHEREPVRLLWDGEDGRLPLADRRALTAPERPDETFRVIDGDPAEPAALAWAAAAGGHAALVGGGLLVHPAPMAPPFRSVACAATDPVSLALVEGLDEAAFPRLRGWSARELGRRAVAEHAAWMHRWRVEGRRSERGLGLLLTAARAGLFLESVERGRAALPLTIAATVRMLGERGAAEGATARAAAEELSACRRESRRPDQRYLVALHELVADLPAYRAP